MMIFSRSNLSTRELVSLVLVMMYTTFSVLVATNNIKSVQAVSFNFNKFTPGDSSITLQGDAKILAKGIVALTNSTPVPSGKTFSSTGRALYSEPVPLWDSATGNIASFVTSFSFVIKRTGGGPTDGLIFFIAPQDTVIPNNSGSSMLGVANRNNANNQFVGVEFDIYTNPWDPSGYHIGIDVNSLISAKIRKWEWVSGSLYKVNITYDSSSKTLSVLVTSENGKISTIAQVLDLKDFLPNKVRIGLSGTTITGLAHDIHSWSFTSTLETTRADNNIASI